MTAGEGARSLTVTTAAAEKVYRAIEPDAEIAVKLTGAAKFAALLAAAKRPSCSTAPQAVSPDRRRTR